MCEDGMVGGGGRVARSQSATQDGRSRSHGGHSRGCGWSGIVCSAQREEGGGTPERCSALAMLPGACDFCSWPAGGRLQAVLKGDAVLLLGLAFWHVAGPPATKEMCGGGREAGCRRG